jgi:hypothetical protein
MKRKGRGEDKEKKTRKKKERKQAIIRREKGKTRKH